MTEGSGKQSGSDQTVMTEQVSKGAQQVSQQAQQAAQQAVTSAKSTIDSQKDKSVDTLSQTATALHKTGQDLQQNNVPVAPQVVDMAANKIEDVAGYLRNKNIVELIDDAERYARNNGAIVMGGAFVLGLLAARFLKSSPPDQGNGTGYYGGGQYAGYRRGSYRGGINSGAPGYEPYSYGETFTGYEPDTYMPGYEASGTDFASNTATNTSSSEGTM